MSVTARMASVALVVLGVCFAGVAGAGVVTYRYDFAEPVIEYDGEYHNVTMRGAWSHGEPGQPVLPMKGARLLLPPGETVSEITISPGQRIVLGDGYTVRPGQRQYPLSHEGPVEMVPADYAGRGVLPDALHGEPVVGSYRGYSIANVPLHPVEFDPATGAVAYYTSFEVTVRTETTRAGIADVERMIRHDDRTLSALARMVDNAYEASQYAAIDPAPPASRSLDPALDYRYIIVTTDSWDGYLTDFVDYQTERGLKAGVFLRSWISSNYSGADDQEKIREFIVDAYNTWPVEYVLLVGDARDANGIPHRGLYASGYGDVDTDIPGDCYYSSLDGNWNADGDSYYGEAGSDDPDYYPDLGIGRFCVSNADDVTQSVTKAMRYTEQPVVAECDEAIMVGELLWSSPLTYGGTYKDQIKDGSSANGYTTVGFPGTMNVGTLYDRDYTWSDTELINTLESGMNIVNHLGHCNTTYSMKLVNSDIPSFDNDGTVHSYNFVYSQGCYCGSFDDRTTSPGSYTDDCFAELFATDDDGAVATIMNSRYGWGDPGGTDGSSQYFDREFFDAMFAEGIYSIADANDDSKVDVIWAINYGANRWCHYQLNVFGDPALHLWTAEPTTMTISGADSVFVGQPDVTFTVTDASRAPVAGARVVTYADDHTMYDSGITDALGMVTLSPDLSGTGMLNIKATAHDRLDETVTIPVMPASGPYVAYDSHTIDDDTLDESNGNDNGAANAGETLELFVTLTNYGVDPATGVVATLSTGSGRVTLLDDTETYGDIGAGSSVTGPDGFVVEIDPTTPDGETIMFDLVITDGNRATWGSSFAVPIAAPELAFVSSDADDPLYGGNGNGCMEAGETIDLSVVMTNDGSATATGLTGTLTSSDPYVQINEATANVPFITSGSSGTFSGFSITLLPDCPGDYEVSFDVDVTGNWGYATSAQFTLRTATASFADDFESGPGDWTHSNISGGFTDDWHMETYRSHSASTSWKFGGAGSGNYSDSADGGLVTKPMCIGADGEMTFWHWLDAEEESSTSAWDCCLVEISTDGGTTWSTLTPDGGYSHTKNSNPANPLPEGTPCWSGYFTWRQETFDLSSYEGETIQVRFRFASDGYVTEEGWYVDDVNIVTTSTTGIEGGEITPVAFELRQNAPNPFNPTTVIRYSLPEQAKVTVEVYNIAGRKVRTLVDEEQEAGLRSVTWDGTDDAGRSVASGVYLYRIDAGEHSAKRRMVLLK
ncbi:MAG: T9SS type A sorting domain-containing protein [Candidatus Eisenbacteria bacterium]|nr:T9SS type A sorting domain-containing protein [Candidatus Eisenbacteria bacterium]